MVTGSLVEISPAAVTGMRGGANFDDFERELDAVLREPHQNATRVSAALELERELNIYRSGSAPPTVEGSRAAIGQLFGDNPATASSEEEIRAHPAYLSYYYSNEHLNPRLPPPMISKEDWRAAQRFHAFGGIGDRNARWDESGDGDNRSLFSLQPGVSLQKELEGWNQQQNLSRQQSGEWGSNGLIGLADVGLGGRRKSFADVIQEDMGRSTSITEQNSRPASLNAFGSRADPLRVAESQLSQLQNGPEHLPSRSASPNLARVQSLGSSMSHSFASVLTPARTGAPDRLPIGRSSPSPPNRGRVPDADRKSIVGADGIGSDSADVAAAFSGLSLSKHMICESGDQAQGQFQQDIANKPDIAGVQDNFLLYNELSKKNGILNDIELSKLAARNGRINLAKPSPSINLYNKGASMGLNNSVGSSSHYQHADINGALPNIYANQGRPLNSHLDKGTVLAGGVEVLYQNRGGSQLGSNFQLPVGDPSHAQYLQGALESGPLPYSRIDPSLRRNLLATSQVDFPAYQKAYLALVAQQKLQYDMPLVNKTGVLNQGIYGNHAFNLGMAYQTCPLSSTTSLTAGNPFMQSERLSHFPSMSRNDGGSMGVWSTENGVAGEGFSSSLLDEFKNNKARSYELSDIVDHVVEFSADQFGSRFIQQKLETASIEEKNKIFPEILPHACALMTDVFGNYVIQKFFEHGTESQRKELASQLIGHVLPLSLQMYGCRVIQKALEVVDIDYQTQMVAELDGSVMKCVRDQNGNHVIQKCIECVPQEKIQFIISAFYGQVLPLSMHPYGCRVIQRVLEHCDDPKTQSMMMDEILQSVCTLSQDQYGNYVVQHVLEQGKSEERSAIINKLVGQIVKMSQQKFASNVVEKCLTHGTPEQRQLLINEMLGTTDENEPLQAMMKDQYGNYVVQKVLETCDDHNRELILSRIKVHLNALKKYTYGKHIVARVEKLITAGERRSAISSSYAS